MDGRGTDWDWEWMEEGLQQLIAEVTQDVIVVVLSNTIVWLSGVCGRCLNQLLLSFVVCSELSLSQAASRKGSTSGGNSPLIRTRFSSSHPDLSTLKLCPDEFVSSSFPDHVLKIFQDDQSFKYLMVFKVRNFPIHDRSLLLVPLILHLCISQFLRSVHEADKSVKVLVILAELR